MVVNPRPKTFRVGKLRVVGNRRNRPRSRNLLHEQHGVAALAPQLREHRDFGGRVVLLREDNLELVVAPVPDPGGPRRGSPTGQQREPLVAPHVAVPCVTRAHARGGVRVVGAVIEGGVDARPLAAAHVAVQRPGPRARRGVFRKARRLDVVLQLQLEPPVDVHDEDLVG